MIVLQHINIINISIVQSCF